MENKNILPLVVGLLLAGASLFFIKKPVVSVPITPAGAASLKDASYTVEGKSTTLTGEFRYFGNEAKGDFDGDGRSDTAFIFTDNPGGSGTFYYVAVALNKSTGYVGSQAYFIGDRISPQTTELGDGNTIVVNYADRKDTDSFTTPPSIGKTLKLNLNLKDLSLIKKP